jgi:hypothetical protein
MVSALAENHGSVESAVMGSIKQLLTLAALNVGFALGIVTSAHAAPAESRAKETGFGAQWQLVQGKAMPGITLRLGGGLCSGVLETSLIWLTEPDPERRVRFLGSQFGAFLMVRPLSVGRFDLAAGLGVDYYPLWNVHGDEWQLALAARASGHVRLSSSMSLFGTARAYPLSTRGLELGIQRDGSAALPVLFGTGIEWRLQ